MPTPSDFHFFEDMFSRLTTALNAYVNETAVNVITAITPVVTTLITIYVVLWGWSMIRGVIQEPVLDGLGRIVRLALITGIALNIGHYNTYLSNFLWESPEALASMVLGPSSTSTSSVQFLDGLLSKLYDYGMAFYQAAQANSTLGIPDLGKVAAANIIWLIGVAVTGYAAFLFILAKMALAVLLAVGPIFIIFMMFEPTKKMFDAWMGQVLNFVFSVMLAAAVLGLILKIVEAFLVSPDAIANMADTEIAGAIPVLAYGVIAILVLIQVSSIASALGGGVAVGTLGAVNWAYGKAKGGVSSMRPTNVRRSLNKAKSDVRIAGGAARAVAGAPMAAYRKVTGANKNRVSKG